MALFIQCLIFCAIFTFIILPAQYKNPLSQFASYPTAIRKRIEELPQYKGYIKQVERGHWQRKILAVLLLIILLAVIAYLSGCRSFGTAFFHVFILFLSVNLYDLIVLDLIIFCHSKKLMIPGTEDMTEEYRNPMHHIKGAIKGCAIGAVGALLSALFALLITAMIK